MLAASTGPLLAAGQEPCDPHVTQPPGDPLGYRLRGDRCEGRYVADVAGTTLHIASLTRTLEDYDPASGEDLLVEWAAPGRGQVRLQGMGLRPRLYYRMDAARPGDQSSFRWPVSVLAGLKIAGRDLGVVAWTRLSLGGTERTVYLPVAVSRDAGSVRGRAYRLIVWPGRELGELFVSLASVGSDGNPARRIRDGQPLRHGFYPADRGITVEIPLAELGARGVYHLLIAATVRGGGASSLEAWFHHAGP